MVFMPPRHGKSHLISEYFPAWFMGRNPEKYVIATSYGQDLASDFGRKVRNLIGDEPFKLTFRGVSLSEDSQASNRFSLNKGGSYHAVGYGGPITGRGAHLLIIDDPIKNREDANSEIYRKNIKSWYTSTAYTRLMPDAAIIIVQTRWHEDDLAGWLLDDPTEKWETLSLPAITDGKALWPEKYSLETLENIKRTLDKNGKSDWSALYMQNPVTEGGEDFKIEKVQYYDNRSSSFKARGMNVYILYDPANSKKKTSDFTAIVVIGLSSDENYYVLDLIRDKLNPAERIQTLMKVHRKWLKESGKSPKVVCEEYAMSTDAFYLKMAQDDENYRFPIVTVGGPMKKEDRIRRLVPLWNAGRLYMPKYNNYTSISGEAIDLVDYMLNKEFALFPYSTHDDMIDALARITDVEVNAIFPKLEERVKVGIGNQSNHRPGGFDERDFMTW